MTDYKVVLTDRAKEEVKKQYDYIYDYADYKITAEKWHKETLANFASLAYINGFSRYEYITTFYARKKIFGGQDNPLHLKTALNGIHYKLLLSTVNTFTDGCSCDNSQFSDRQTVVFMSQPLKPEGINLSLSSLPNRDYLKRLWTQNHCSGFFLISRSMQSFRT